jgi:hypothetical protein
MDQQNVMLNHIHVPRCSGIYLKSHITAELKTRGIEFFASNSSKISPETFYAPQFVSGHFGTTPELYNTRPINVLILRNPTDRYISNYLYVEKTPTIAGLREWMLNDRQANLQARCLTKPLNLDEYNSSTQTLERSEKGWCLEETPILAWQAVKRLGEMDLVGTVESYLPFLNKFNKLLNTTFGFTTFSNKHKLNSNVSTFEVPASIRKEIRDLNWLDWELYECAKSSS